MAQERPPGFATDYPPLSKTRPEAFNPVQKQVWHSDYHPQGWSQVILEVYVQN